MRGRIKLRIRQRITVRALSKVLLPRKRRPGVIAARKARYLRARTDGTAATSPPLVSARTTRTRTRTRDAARETRTQRARDSSHAYLNRRRRPEGDHLRRARHRRAAQWRPITHAHTQQHKTPITSHMGTHTTYYTPQPSNIYTTPHHAIVGARIRHGANPRSTTKTRVFRDPAAGSRSVDWFLSQSTRARGLSAPSARFRDARRR